MVRTGAGAMTTADPRSTTAARDARTFIAILAVAAFLLCLDPPGYFGGHWDDGRYLDAALRWVAAGPLTGAEHWALRWPVVLPAAAIIEVFGRSRAALMLPGVAAFLALLAVVFWGTRARFGIAAATVATLALVTTPEVLSSATRLTADIPEVLFWTASLAAFACASRAEEAARVRWLIAAGAAAGLAWAVRETSLSLLLVLALAVATERRAVGRGVPWRSVAWLGAGFLAVYLPEHLALYAATGDPLYRLHVDLRHIDVPSDNLHGSVAPGQSAPLNPGVMRRWEGIGPVRLNYLVDPWLNLFINNRYGLDFLIAAAGAGFAWRGLDSRARRAVGACAVVAALHVITIVYIVATDPKARMMMPAIVAACVACGLVLPPLWARARGWLTAAAALKLAVLLVTIDLTAVFNVQYPALADAVLAAAPGPVYAGRWTLSQLALADETMRARLRPGPPPPGGLWLTTARLGDPHGDAAPDPALRWQRIAQARGGRLPFVVRLGRLVGAPVESVVARNTPAATLWRRLPDAPPAACSDALECEDISRKHDPSSPRKRGSMTSNPGVHGSPLSRG